MAIEKQQAPITLDDVVTILRCEVGSTVHGIGVKGTDDRDEMGVCLEPLDFVIGLRHFEQFTQRRVIVGVRTGEYTENQALTLAGELEAELIDAIDSSPLPDQPNYYAVNSFLIDEYTNGLC